MSNAVPLPDVLPWQPSHPPTSGGRTVLVCDSVRSDGKFVLYALASQALSLFTSNAAASTFGSGRGRRRRQHVLWVACGPSTESQVANGLRKIGCDAAAYLARRRIGREVGSNAVATEAKHKEGGGLIKIISVSTELAEAMAGAAEDGGVDGRCNERESVTGGYPKQLYQRIKAWALSSSSDSSGPSSSSSEGDDVLVVVIDDATQLSVFLGERAAYFLLLHLRSLIKSLGGGLVVRCSHPPQETDHHANGTCSSDSDVGGGEGDAKRWIGAGGMKSVQERSAEYAALPPWESSLAELADGIVDVTPLPSGGYARDVHGRLAFTERAGGRGWWGDGTFPASSKSSSSSPDGAEGAKAGGTPGALLPLKTAATVNYCCVEDGVRAIRLRSGT